MPTYKIVRIIVTEKECSPKKTTNKKGQPNFALDERKVSDLFDRFLAAAKKNGSRFDFVLFPAGTLVFPFPNDGTAECSDADKIRDRLKREAERTVRNFIGNRAEAIKNAAKHVLFGIDSDGDGNDHGVQLVAVYHADSGKITWTGKSYPYDKEKKFLIPMPIETHFVMLNRKPAAILCCHDLTIYNHRGAAALNPESCKGKQSKRFLKECKRFQPEIVLHLAHSTNKSRTWLQAWSGIVKALPVEHYASGIKYIATDKSDPRNTLESVLEKTKLGDVVEFFDGTLHFPAASGEE